MKALFINDHPFIQNIDGSYSTSGTLPAIVWDRYLNHFETLTVFGRGRLSSSERNKSPLTSKKNVEFVLLNEVKGGVDYFRYKKRIYRELYQLISEHDAVIIRLPSFFGLIAAKICKHLKKKYVVEAVGCAHDSLWYFGPNYTKLIAPYFTHKTKRAVAHSAGTLYVTKRYLQEKYPTNGFSCIASNVQLESTSQKVLDDRLKCISSKKSELKFGMIGNTSMKYKGYDVLLKALSRFKNSHENFMLHFVGGGDQTHIKTLLKKYGLGGHVVFEGRLESRKAIFEFLDSLDIYFQPSMTEGLPRAVIEAMSRGCPVLASNAGGIPELIQNEYLHQPKDHMKLLSNINYTIFNRKLLTAMSKYNFEKAKEYEKLKLESQRFDFFQTYKNCLNEA